MRRAGVKRLSYGVVVLLLVGVLNSGCVALGIGAAVGGAAAEVGWFWGKWKAKESEKSKEEPRKEGSHDLSESR
jgi:hypothetical protein